MKVLVLYHPPNSTIDVREKRFDTDVDADKFIEAKVLSGVTCHKYTYDSTYQQQTQILKTRVII